MNRIVATLLLVGALSSQAAESMRIVLWTVEPAKTPVRLQIRNEVQALQDIRPDVLLISAPAAWGDLEEVARALGSEYRLATASQIRKQGNSIRSGAAVIARGKSDLAWTEDGTAIAVAQVNGRRVACFSEADTNLAYLGEQVGLMRDYKDRKPEMVIAGLHNLAPSEAIPLDSFQSARNGFVGLFWLGTAQSSELVELRFPGSRLAFVDVAAPGQIAPALLQAATIPERWALFRVASVAPRTARRPYSEPPAPDYTTGLMAAAAAAMLLIWGGLRLRRGRIEKSTALTVSSANMALPIDGGRTAELSMTPVTAGALEKRLSQLQDSLVLRIDGYENRIARLEKELETAEDEKRELLETQIRLLRVELAAVHEERRITRN